jgi:uncharacterized protein with ParB-like and HNH nuclease domain
MNERLNAIEAEESTIGHIFSGEYALEISPYQRPYAWEQEQVEDPIEQASHRLTTRVRVVRVAS